MALRSFHSQKCRPEEDPLSVSDPYSCQRAGTFPDPDDLLEGIIGQPHGGEQFVTGEQVCAESNRQRMGAAGDLRADQSGFRMEHVRLNPFQIVPSKVVIAVTGGSREAGRGNPVFLHGP